MMCMLIGNGPISLVTTCAECMLSVENVRSDLYQYTCSLLYTLKTNLQLLYYYTVEICSLVYHILPVGKLKVT